MKTRVQALAARAGLILGIGLAYALFWRLTGLALPCPFHALTGLWCPGCGVSRMCLALLRGDMAAAWDHNPALMLLGPALALLLGKMGAGYVRTGRTQPTRGERAAVWVLAALLLAFGVLRNLPGFQALAPG